MAHVIRNFERPAKADLEAIGKFSPATIHEAQGKLGALDPQIKPIKPGLKFCGPAITAQCHIGDNLMIFEAINLAQPGDILVLSAGNNPNQGGFGDVLAAACIGKGIAGLVIDAGVRDGVGLRAIGFPVFSLGLCIKGTSKDTLGTINNPVVVGGELIRPGDIIVGDDDGVVVVRTDNVAKLAKACQDREDTESQLIEMHRKGQMSIEDRYEMMRSKGCVWSD
ncbi:4-carboxy-4-hydroxy-2-oxoadipate aldolase/oxaloacetate decarboxylase [Devosia sp. A369]